MRVSTLQVDDPSRPIFRPQVQLPETARLQFGGRLQAGYKFAFDRFAVTPFLAVQYLQLWQSGYAETSFTAAGAHRDGIEPLRHQECCGVRQLHR
jgi:uncharacterized protein with beta-barrel porin domain